MENELVFYYTMSIINDKRELDLYCMCDQNFTILLIIILFSHIFLLNY